MGEKKKMGKKNLGDKNVIFKEISLDELRGKLRLNLWRQLEIDNTFDRLLKIANIDPTDDITLRQRCRAEENRNSDKTEERYFIDNKLVMIVNYQLKDENLILNIISPITEGELNV